DSAIVQERRIGPDGTPDGTIHNLSASGASPDSPRVAVGSDGTATVVWVLSDGSDEIVQERRIAPGGTPHATTHDLSAPGQDATPPRVAVAPDGTATVVWVRSDGSNQIVEERRITPGGTPDTTYDLSATGQNAGEAQVAVGSDGTATVVWTRSNGSNE